MGDKPTAANNKTITAAPKQRGPKAEIEVNDNTGNPIRGAAVWIWSQLDDLPHTTGQNGKVTIGPIVPGSYDLKVWKPGYGDEPSSGAFAVEQVVIRHETFQDKPDLQKFQVTLWASPASTGFDRASPHTAHRPRFPPDS
jgi:hypothetical protein